MNASIKNNVTILFLSIGVVMVAGGLFITDKTKKAFDSSAFWTEHTHLVLFETQNVLSIIQDVQLGIRGYTLTGDSTFLEPLNRSTSLALTGIQKIRTLTLDNSLQTPRIDSVVLLTRALINYITQCANENGFLDARGNGKDKLYVDSIRYILVKVQKTEYKLLQLRKEANQKSAIALNRIFIFLFCIQVLFMIIIFFVVRNNIKATERNDKSEIRFRNTLDEMLEGAEILGFDFRYLYVNKAYEKQVRHTREELLGYTVMEKFPGIEQTEIFSAIQQCIRERIAIHLEDNFTFPDKTKTWFEISFQPVPEGVFILSIDITEKKQATEKIRQSEERFRSLIENSYDIVSIIDKDLMPIYRSPAATRVTGWTTKDLEEKGSVEQAHPDDLAIVRSTLIDVKNNPGVPFPLSYRTKHKDGHYISIEGVVTNLLHNESIKGIVSNFKDVTETQKAKESMRLSELRFRSLIENSYDIVSIVDESFKPIYRSPSAIRLTGYTNEERDLIGGGTQQTHPDDIELATRTMKEVLANPRVPISLRFRVKHKAGHYVLIDGTVTNMIHDESIKGIIANFRDITATQKAEEKIRESEKIYKTIASSIPGSVISLFDKDYRYLLIEGDMLEAMGYVKEELLGNKMEDVIAPDRLAEVLPHFRRVFEGESFMVENFRAGFDILSRFVPLRDENNRVFAAMVVIFDVSELKNAQRALAELNTKLEYKIKERTLELETANKELEAFSYSIAHDLRTPLRAIYGYATMLEEDYGHQFDNEGKRLIRAVEGNAKKMGSLIDDLLTFSRLGRTAIKRTLTNMTEVAEISLKEINVDDAYAGEINIKKLHSVMVDSSLMKQVMINLLSNAIKYSSKKEKPVIEISSHQQNGEIIYSVSDNGAGFNMKYAHNLFGVFQRLHSTEEFEGTGVGLAIAERIIHKHDGKIWAKGEVNQGATFYFSLPVLANTP